MEPNKILRNSAKCTACDTEIESKFGHHFNVHYCDVEPRLGPDAKNTWRFAVDGGKEYLRRAGTGWVDTSIFKVSSSS